MEVSSVLCDNILQAFFESPPSILIKRVFLKSVISFYGRFFKIVI